ncbi:DUF3558 family protein [Nocardioides speluncae]|uniref:DUF3558 family protein n=1 Tax=Nocardioides speluncae TaxID=2670337 RepID=UPI00137A1316|nr:DUF3558 family protein [Nocardioides speluncae]
MLSLLLGLLLLTACSGSDDAESTDDPATPSTSTSQSQSAPESSASESPSSESDDACTLLTAAEIKEIVGGPATAPEPGDLAGVPQCLWRAKAGTQWVQAASTDASVWSRSLPEILKQIEASGLVTDKTNLKKLRKGAALVESGQDLESDEACSVFSEMLEVQGRPPGSQSIVTVIPNTDKPKAVTAQICSGGHYTTVSTADPSGLEDRLPNEAVGRAARRVHRAATT